VSHLQSELIDLKVVVAKLEGELNKERDKAKRYWHQQCDLLALHEASLEEKNDEIVRLKKKAIKLESLGQRSFSGEGQGLCQATPLANRAGILTDEPPSRQ